MNGRAGVEPCDRVAPCEGGYVPTSHLRRGPKIGLSGAYREPARVSVHEALSLVANAWVRGRQQVGTTDGPVVKS